MLAFGGQKVLAVQIFGLPPIVGGQKMARIASRSAPCPNTSLSLKSLECAVCMHNHHTLVCTPIVHLVHTFPGRASERYAVEQWCRRQCGHSHSNVEPCWAGDEWLRRRVRGETCQFSLGPRSTFVGLRRIIHASRS